MCDGYETKQSASKPLEYVSAQGFPMDTTIKALSVIPGPTIRIAGTDQERRSFAFFCSQIGQQLSIALNIPQTQNLILQASHCDEAVRYGVIALGSIGERLSINNLLTMENMKANACHTFAQLQYCKALKHLRERISHDSEGSADLAIITCFLLTVFEFLQGNDAGSLIHLRSGLNILRRDHGSLSTALQTVSPDRDPLGHDILRIFSIMDMQATMWLGLRTFQAPVMIPLDDPGDRLKNPSVFSGLEQAAESLNYHITTIYRFRRLVAAFDVTESPGQVPPPLHAEREKMLVQMEKWPVSLATLTANLGGEIDAVMLQRIVVMKMNFKINLIILTACLQPSDQEVYADHEPEFREIVELAKSIIGSMDDETKLRIQDMVAANNGGINPIAMFSFYAGVIQPLYCTAVKCQNLSVCREAITLLASSPWREGAWDSATMARIASRRVQEIEERATNTDPWILTYGYAQRLQARQM